MMRALEARIMFDASVIAVAEHVESAADSFVHEAPMPAAPVERDTAATEIVFIDSAVSNYENLVASLPDGVEVVILDAGQNGFAQIAAHLQGRSDITTIDIISHGDEGYVYLAGQALWADQLDDHAAELARIGEALTSDGDIRFFACNTGDGADGQLFVSEMARLTGVDVAASTDATGHRAGENWALEVTAGSVATAVGVERANLSAFNTSLATITVTSTDASSVAVNGQVSLAEAIQAANGDTAVDGSAAGSGSDIIVFHSSLAGQTIRWSSPSSISVTSNITINGDIDGDGVGDVILSGDVDNDGVRDAGEASGLQSDGGGALTVRNLDFRHFSGNAANGVIRANAGSITIEDSVFRNNAGTVINSNTAIGSTVVVRNTLIHDNDASIVGFTGMSSLVRLGGSNNHILQNVVLVNNTGTYGAAGTVASGGIIILSNGAGSVTITNSTIANNAFTNTSSGTINTGGIGWALSGNSGAFILQNNIVVGNTVDAGSANLSAGTSYTGTTNLVDTTVDFVNTGSRDYRLASTAANAIDQGTLVGSPTTDLRGFNRPRGSGVDIGAYEVLYSAAPVVDLDTGAGGNDSAVNFSGTAVAIVPNVDISQSDGDTQVSGITLSLSGVLNGGDETLSLTAGQMTTAAGFGITVGGSGSTAMSLAGVSSLANYEAILALVQYNNTNGAYAAGTRSVAVNITDDLGSTTRTASIVVALANTAPAIANLNADSVAWAGVGSTVVLDASANASLTDNELGALNAGNGNWNGASLTVQRSSAVAADTFDFNTSGALFTVSGGNLQSGGQTFATYTNTGGVLTINFTSSGTTATTALVNDVAQRINYRNDTPAGDATIRFTLHDGTVAGTVANVAVTTDSIFVTNTTDTASIDVSNGVSISEAVAIAAADATGSQTIVFNNSLAATTLAVNSVSLNESLTFDLDASSGLTLSGGTITLGAATTQTFNNGSSDTASISGVISGSGNLVKQGSGTLTLTGANTYSGTSAVSAGTLSVASDSNLGSNGVTLASGATLDITGATTIDNALTLSGAATVNTSADATLSGNINGAGSLAKTGANTLTLSGTNSYAGSTTVSAGTLSIASDSNLGSGTLTLATGTTLVVTSSSTIDNAIALSGNATVQAANSVTLEGVISGAGGLSKTGAGTLTLSGSNGFTGNVAVSAGGLRLGNGAAIDNNSAVTLSSGTTLTLLTSETIGSLAGAGSVVLGANTLTAGGDNSSTSYSGNISGTGGLTKTGAGTLTLSGTNSNTGATTVSAGAIDAQNGDALGNASAVSVASGAFLVLSAAESIGSLAGAGTATLGANTLTTGGNNASTTFSGAITGSNGLVKTGSGTFTLSNTGNESTLSGGMTISAGTVSVADDDQMADGTLTLNGGTLSLDGPTVFDNNIDLAASSTINSGGNAIASGVISGAGDLTKTGSLSLQLTNTNTYSGATFVNAGYLLANNAYSLGTTAGATNVASGATLYLSGSFTLAEALNLAGTGMLGNGAIYAPSGNSTISGLVTLTGNTTLKLDGDLTFSGGITDGASSYSLTKEDAGTLTLSGTASYDGSTTISSGGLSIGSDSHLGSGTLTLAAGTTLAVTGATTIDNAIALSSGTATINTSANTTLSGNITGAGGLTKTGASALTLSGTDSYASATNVNAGSLLVNGALISTSSMTVASSATLGGNGSIASNVTVNSGGTLSPGNSAGILTIDGDLAMASGSTLVVEINGTTAGTGYDQVIVNGTVDVSGATLSATHGYAAASGDSYNIIVNDAADAVTGSFSGVSEGATVTAGGNSTVLTASYIGATGNDITLTAPFNPVVTGVSSSTPNGTYKIGDTISVSVTFDMAVFVSGGTPTLQLETGTVDRTLDYVSGSGSTTLVFDYVVQAGDVSADLDYTSTGALVLNGATLQDALNQNADLTLVSPGAANSLGANKALVLDGVAPTASIVVADTALAAGETSTATITFSEAVSGLAVGDFTVANGVLSSLSTADNITWTATLTPTASTLDASNLITLASSAVQDAAGNANTGTIASNNYAVDTAGGNTGTGPTDSNNFATPPFVALVSSEVVIRVSSPVFTPEPVLFEPAPPIVLAALDRTRSADPWSEWAHRSSAAPLTISSILAGPAWGGWSADEADEQVARDAAGNRAATVVEFNGRAPLNAQLAQFGQAARHAQGQALLAHLQAAAQQR